MVIDLAELDHFNEAVTKLATRRHREVVIDGAGALLQSDQHKLSLSLGALQKRGLFDRLTLVICPDEGERLNAQLEALAYRVEIV